MTTMSPLWCGYFTATDLLALPVRRSMPLALLLIAGTFLARLSLPRFSWPMKKDRSVLLYADRSGHNLLVNIYSNSIHSAKVLHILNILHCLKY